MFHVGVKEKVFVQMGKAYLNNIITLYLEHETSNTVVSEKKTVECKNEGSGETVELKVRGGSQLFFTIYDTLVLKKKHVYR